MQKAHACVERLTPLFRAVAERKDLRSLVEEICGLETEADALKNEIRAHLPKSIFLPVSRRDVLEILTLQDMIADVAQDIAVTLTIRTMRLDPRLEAPLERLLGDATRVSSEVAQVTQELDELLETSFAGKEAERVLGMLEAINVDDSIPDTATLEAERALFSAEAELSPADLILWYQIIRQLGRLADLAEGVGNRIRLLLAK